MRDGISVDMEFDGEEDVTRHFVYPVQDGQSIVRFSLKSLEEDFQPRLYVQVSRKIDQDMKELRFPSSQHYSALRKGKWDKITQTLEFMEEINNK